MSIYLMLNNKRKRWSFQLRINSQYLQYMKLRLSQLNLTEIVLKLKFDTKFEQNMIPHLEPLHVCIKA
jgi:hypothetical protein